MLAMVIPAKGEIACGLSKFEEERARELIKMVRTFAPGKKMSPYQRVAEILRDREFEPARLVSKNASAFSLRRHSSSCSGIEVRQCYASDCGLSNVQVACGNRAAATCERHHD
jgi:hypothetical protein